VSDARGRGQFDEAKLLRLGIRTRRRDEVRARDAVERRFKGVRVVEVPRDEGRRRVCSCGRVWLPDHRADVGGPSLQLLQECRARVSCGTRDENQIGY
jgi:hypothetical protein